MYHNHQILMDRMPTPVLALGFYVPRFRLWTMSGCFNRYFRIDIQYPPSVLSFYHNEESAFLQNRDPKRSATNPCKCNTKVQSPAWT